MLYIFAKDRFVPRDDVSVPSLRVAFRPKQSLNAVPMVFFTNIRSIFILGLALMRTQGGCQVKTPDRAKKVEALL